MMNKTKPKIMLGIPTMGSIHTFTAVRIMGWIAEGFAKGSYDLAIYPTIKVSPVDQARNEIVRQFLESEQGFTHLLQIDADTIPPENALSKMLAYDFDFVSALTPIVELDAKRANDSNGFYKEWNASDSNNKRMKPNTGLQAAQGVGGSCTLIKRKVFETVPEPWYRFEYTDDNGKPCVVGEDIRFTAKTLQAGFKVFVDTDLICGHEKSIIWQ